MPCFSWKIIAVRMITQAVSPDQKDTPMTPLSHCTGSNVTDKFR